MQFRVDERNTSTSVLGSFSFRDAKVHTWSISVVFLLPKARRCSEQNFFAQTVVYIDVKIGLECVETKKSKSLVFISM